jgi:hypothetical protein
MSELKSIVLSGWRHSGEAMIDSDLFIVGEDGLNYQISPSKHEGISFLIIDRWGGTNHEVWFGCYEREIENDQIKWKVEEELGAYQTPPDVRNDIDRLLKLMAFW